MPAGKASTDDRLRDLYEQGEAARRQSKLLAEELRASQRKAQENWQLIQASWDRTEGLRAQRLAARTDPDRLRYSAYARLQARLASMPVIEQAKGIIMARYGWPEDQAFDELRRASQRGNMKVRDLAASIVARASHSAPAQRHAGPASAAQPGGDVTARMGSGGPRNRRRAPA